MNILIVTHELPFPAVHGGRIDIWNRIRSLKQLGNNVFLICWAPNEDDKNLVNINHVKNVVDVLEIFSRKSGKLSRLTNKLNKIRHLFKRPNIATECTLSKNKYHQIVEQLMQFNPDFIWLDGIYAGETADKLAGTLNIPLFIRSNNIEHQYVRRLISDAKSWKVKFSYWGMSWNMKNYETALLKKAKAFFDCSVSDLEYWKNKGIVNGYWMPPMYLPVISQSADLLKTYPAFDVTFIGNLYSPNNIKAITWFLEKVAPLIRLKIPNISILIAGYRPSETFIGYCKSNKNVTIIPNPVDLIPLYKNSNILINPILTGSGVNVKTIEMVHQDNPIVSTSLAIHGLPYEFEKVVHIADSDSEFADTIINLLNNKLIPVNQEYLEKVRQYFTIDFLSKNMMIIKNLCELN